MYKLETQRVQDIRETQNTEKQSGSLRLEAERWPGVYSISVTYALVISQGGQSDSHITGHHHHHHQHLPMPKFLAGLYITDGIGINTVSLFYTISRNKGMIVPGIDLALLAGLTQTTDMGWVREIATTGRKQRQIERVPRLAM